MMKKLFSGGGNDKSSWVGKVLHVGRHQCLIEEIIAEGGYALVFLVKSSVGQRYALKRVSVNEIDNLEMCKQEIAVLKMLSGHKNTIGYIDSIVNTLSPGIYEVLILMEYCKAGHVVQLMNECIQTGFTEKTVMRIFCDVCEAVALLHGNKPAIIHRDLKVENVLRKQTGDFVLCDYGSAHFGVIDPQVEGIQNVEDDIASCTTLAYRAPEMVDLYSGQKITVKADIWALGCLLYKLCFFTTPFGESVLAIQNGQFTFPESARFSDSMYTLIKMMLHVDQTKRADINQVAGFAFNMIGKPCPVRSLQQVRSAPAQPKRPAQRPAALPKPAVQQEESADGRSFGKSQHGASTGAATPHHQQLQPKSSQPVSTSLAPRQRPKGVAKFATASDTASPTPFKNENTDSHGQPQHSNTRASQQQQPFDSHDYHAQPPNSNQMQHHLQKQTIYTQQQQQKQQQQQQHQQQQRQQNQQQHQQQQQQQQLARQQLFQQQRAFEQQQQHMYEQQRQAYEQQQQQKAYEQYQRQQQIYIQQMLEQQRIAERQVMQQKQQLELEARRLEQQRHQFRVEQERRRAEFQMSNNEHPQFDATEARDLFDAGNAAFSSYQKATNNTAPSVRNNPFDDNFSADKEEGDVPGNPKVNPFENVFLDDGIGAVSHVKDRIANPKTHFRSRSDTFSDIAKRGNNDCDRDGSVQLLSAGEGGSPHKSSPDIRIEEGQCATKEHTDSNTNMNGYANRTQSNLGQLDLQSYSEMCLKQNETDSGRPKMQLDIGKPVIERKTTFGERTVNSEASCSIVNKAVQAGSSNSDANGSKDEKPTLEEADEFPLISPSSSVQERRYIYVRTSSCSSDEVSEKSKNESSEDEADVAGKLAHYDEIGSSNSSLEAEASSCSIKNADETTGNEDIFGSAPFSVDSKERSTARRKAASVYPKSHQGQRAPDGVSKVPPSPPGNPFGMDPFTVPATSKPCKSEATLPSTDLKVSDNFLSRSPTSEDPFGHAPFVKVVKHRRPLSSQELTERKVEGGDQSQRKIQQRRRMLPRAPVKE